MDNATIAAQPSSAANDVPPFSSVPRDTSIGEAASATSFLALAFGPDGLEQAGAFFAGAKLPAAMSLNAAPAAHPTILNQLRRDLERATVGVRILLAGPEVDVYAARAVVMEAGAVESELLLRVTGVSGRRVYCPHCRATTVTGVGIGGATDCSGCGRSLVVYHHFSRNIASYLGFMADAEDGIKAPADVAA